jgi:hypothetical protein
MTRVFLQLNSCSHTPYVTSSFTRGWVYNLFTNCMCLCVCLPPACLWFLLNLFLRPWRWRPYVLPKLRLKLIGLHGIIFQKMILFCMCLVWKFIYCNTDIRNVLPPSSGSKIKSSKHETRFLFASLLGLLSDGGPKGLEGEILYLKNVKYLLITGFGWAYSCIEERRKFIPMLIN